MDASERKARTPSKSEREILSDIASGRVTRETAAAMWDHIVPGDFVDAAGVSLEEDEASDIRTQFMDAVEGLAESEIPHARLVLSRVFVPALAERASAPFEFLITTAQKKEPQGSEEATRLLLRKAHLFDPAHPPTAIDAYRRWIEFRPRSEPARQRLKGYQVSWDDHARYGLGRLLHRTGDLAGAERVYRDLLALPAGTPVVRARALKALATTVGALGRPAEELELRGQATRETKEWMDSLAARFNEKAARARAATDAGMERLSHAAAEATKRGDHHAADESLSELLERLGRQLESLGRLHFRAGEFQAAVVPTERAGAIFEQIGDREALGRALSLLGVIELRRERLESAERYLRLASAIHMERFDNRSAASSLSALGELAYRRGDLDAARDAWQKALARYSNMDLWESHDAKRIRAMLDRTR